MRSKLRCLLPGLVVLFICALNGCGSTTSNSSAVVNNLWIATQNDRMVRSYTLDETTGVISPIGSGGPLATGTQPVAIALSPDRTVLFVANSGDNTVSMYNVNVDGSLASALTPVQAGTTPVALAVDSADNLLFVADQGSDSIMVFGISPATFMSPAALILKASFAIQTPAAPGGSGPAALVISPTFISCVDNRTLNPLLRNCFVLYAANQIAGTVTAYDYFFDGSGNFVRGSIDLSGNFIVGGTVAGSPYTAGTNPSALAFSRCAGIGLFSGPTSCGTADANSLFVANSGSNDITIFSACIQLPTCHSGESNPDGTLVQVGSPVAAGSGPSAVLVDPAANFVYVVDAGSNQVSGYQYTHASGTLTALGTTSSGGSSVFSGAITPNINNLSNTHTWVVVTSTGALPTFSAASDGSLAASSGQNSITGQPSAILIK